MITQKIRCREISETDLEAVADLLTRGFVGTIARLLDAGAAPPGRARGARGLSRVSAICCDNDGTPVGVLLLLYTLPGRRRRDRDHCNLSSWYVEPAFRNYAPMLTKIAQRHKEVTYLNISPATWTWPIIEAQGFSSYCSGLFFSIPALSRATPGMTVETVSPDTQAVEGLSDTEVELLTRHARYGCLSLVCRTADGGAFPFILLPMRIRRGWIAPPAMQLIYCRDIADYVAMRRRDRPALIRHGKISVILDANGPVAGLIGVFSRRAAANISRARIGRVLPT